MGPLHHRRQLKKFADADSRKPFLHPVRDEHDLAASSSTLIPVVGCLSTAGRRSNFSNFPGCDVSASHLTISVPRRCSLRHFSHLLACPARDTPHVRTLIVSLLGMCPESGILFGPSPKHSSVPFISMVLVVTYARLLLIPTRLSTSARNPLGA